MSAAGDNRDVVWNRVALASLAYQQQLDALRQTLGTAHWGESGLTMAELCRASGLDEAFVIRLVGESFDLGLADEAQS